MYIEERMNESSLSEVRNKYPVSLLNCNACLRRNLKCYVRSRLHLIWRKDSKSRVTAPDLHCSYTSVDFSEVKGMRTNLAHHSVARNIHNPFSDRQQEH